MWLEMHTSLQHSYHTLDEAHGTAEKLAEAASDLMAAVRSLTLEASSPRESRQRTKSSSPNIMLLDDTNRTTSRLGIGFRARLI